MTCKTGRLVGKVTWSRADGSITVWVKVMGKYYPATGLNAELFESYLQTGDKTHLEQLTNERSTQS
jgi:hypothetical protein